MNADNVYFWERVHKTHFSYTAVQYDCSIGRALEVAIAAHPDTKRFEVAEFSLSSDRTAIHYYSTLFVMRLNKEMIRPSVPNRSDQHKHLLALPPSPIEDAYNYLRTCLEANDLDSHEVWRKDKTYVKRYPQPDEIAILVRKTEILKEEKRLKDLEKLAKLQAKYKV